MKNVPWWAKILAKMILARLPLGYQMWQKLALFRHGDMDQYSYVEKVFNFHVARCGLTDALDGKVILELGPGDSVASAIFAACHGAKCILIDVGPFAAQDVDVYHRLGTELENAGYLLPSSFGSAKSINDILESCGAVYLTEGLSSFSQVETGTVDMVFSQAVLEHVRCEEFQRVANECYRVLQIDGLASHQIDLKDHLSNSLNNLRFSQKLWESEFFVNSGFYTNRIQYSAMLEMFLKAGFAVDSKDTKQWATLPIARESMDIVFQNIPEDELNISEFDVLLSKKRME
ncbi:class I SAM-dependent methyltransferase [Pseudomonadales bacterium]|nr:class I SAM-dependent methyltransferase [Pseudomonadales bacterium]